MYDRPKIADRVTQVYLILKELIQLVIDKHWYLNVCYIWNCLYTLSLTMQEADEKMKIWVYYLN